MEKTLPVSEGDVPGAETVDDPNKRISRRMRTLKTAKIIHLKQSSVVDCAVRDMSATGAKLVCHDQMGVPNEFRLLMMWDNTIRDCKVMWRKNEFIGVHFTSESIAAPPRKY
jgi:hypothetical protein